MVLQGGKGSFNREGISIKRYYNIINISKNISGKALLYDYPGVRFSHFIHITIQVSLFQNNMEKLNLYKAVISNPDSKK